MPRAAAIAKARPTSSPTLEHRILMLTTMCLLAAGCVMVFSASSARAILSGEGDGTYFLVRYIGYGALGVAVLLLLSRYGLALVLRGTPWLLGIAACCLLALRVPGLGVEVNGATRWLGAGPIVFQPSELMKLALVLYAVKVLAERPRAIESPRGLVPLGVVCGMGVLLVASQPDLGTSLVMTGTLLMVLIAAGVPMRWLGILCGALTALVTIYAFSADYRRARLTTFLDPWEHARDAGFQAVQGQIALGSGGLFGQGLGQSNAKNLFLPEAHTDFILAIIGEEAGAIGVVVLLFLYGLLAFAGLRVAQQARGRYPALLAAGITSMFLCQALLNAFAVLGLAPLTGVPLPLVSYGSTNMIVMLAAMGLLLNVAAGGAVHLRVAQPRNRRGSPARERAEDRHRGRRDGGARRAGARGGRRAAS